MLGVVVVVVVVVVCFCSVSPFVLWYLFLACCVVPLLVVLGCFLLLFVELYCSLVSTPGSLAAWRPGLAR